VEGHFRLVEIAQQAKGQGGDPHRFAFLWNRVVVEEGIDEYAGLFVRFIGKENGIKDGLDLLPVFWRNRMGGRDFFPEVIEVWSASCFTCVPMIPWTFNFLRMREILQELPRIPEGKKVRRAFSQIKRGSRMGGQPVLPDSGGESNERLHQMPVDFFTLRIFHPFNGVFPDERIGLFQIVDLVGEFTQPGLSDQFFDQGKGLFQFFCRQVPDDIAGEGFHVVFSHT